jgi:TonB family protein
MSRVILVFFLLRFSAFLCAQGASAALPNSSAAPNTLPVLPNKPAEIFAAAAPLYDFASPKLKPWHMKVSYQLYDEKGEPSTKGTYEYWWASPDTYRSTWTRSGGEQTDWHVDGVHSHAGSGESLAFFERKIQSDLLTPLPTPAELDPEKVRFERHEQSFGTVKLPCVMVVHKMPSHGQTQTVPMGMFPTYCFDSSVPMLREYYAFGATSVTYNKIARVQGMYLPRELEIYDGQRHVLTATVDLINGISAKADEFRPRSEAIVSKAAGRADLSAAVAQGFLLKSVQPHYPEDAKQARIDGRVVLEALIGTDGRVHELSVVEGPSPSLIGASMWAVSQWQYKPYLLNGEPVEVQTTVNVFFKLSY